MINGQASALTECACMFIIKKDWMRPSSTGQGYLDCPKPTCNYRLGQYSWSGLKCNCGRVVTPGFQIYKSKVKQIEAIVKKRESENEYMMPKQELKL